MERVKKLLAAMSLQKDEAALITKPSNMYYLSGYTGEGMLLLANGLSAIVTDFRYTEQVGQQARGFAAHQIRTGVSHAALAGGLLAAHGVKKVYFEDDEVTVKGMRGLQDAMLDMMFLPIGGAPEKLRRVKDEKEMAAIEEACDISCQAFEYICGVIREGMTEKEIALALDYKMLALGASGLAFSTIVASGENGSLPHAVPGERKVQKGDMITMDFGAKVKGYCADMTRTVALGEPTAQMRDIYALVLRAQEAAQAAQAPGKRCKDIDSIARDMIYAAGYEGCFGHGLGHGVGIDIHEDPRYSQTCDDLLVPGNIMTVEPGVYLPGVGGVRIENTCVITEFGARSLVSASKELRIL